MVVALFASARVMPPLTTSHLSNTLPDGTAFAVRVTAVPSAALLISLPAPIVALPSVTVMLYSIALYVTTTVLFSTHILSDVERICDHVALLNDGYIAVGGTLSEIKALHSHDSLLIEFSSEADLQQFKASMAKQPLLIGSEEKGREMIIHSREMKKAQHTIFSTLAEADLAPVKVALMEPSLESLFLEVIK